MRKRPSTVQAAHLCSATVNFSRAEASDPQKTRFALAPLLDEVGEAVLGPDPGPLRWRNEVGADIRVLADRDQLYRVLMNLDRNAAEALSGAGGLIALWRQPTTVFMSLALGFASGVLLATIGFEMLPKALELGSLPVAVAGFVVGFLAVYGFDLFIHRGQLAGKEAQEHKQVERFHHRHRPRGRW